MQRTMEGKVGEAVEDGEALTPLHPNYTKVLRLQAATTALPFAVVALVLETRDLLPAGTIAIPVLVVAALLVLRVPLRRYHARGFSMSSDRLRVVRGVLFRSDTVVPFGRVQHIDVHQGPLERAFGLATLTVHTAGSHNASVSLPGLAHRDATAMRETIRAHIKRETL